MLSRELSRVVDNTAFILPDSRIVDFTEGLSRIFEDSDTPEERESRILQHCYQSRMDADTEERV